MLEPWRLHPYQYVHQNPIMYWDPDGKAIETPWDVASFGIGLASFSYNVATGNYFDAALDAGGLVFDGAAILVPGMPGGASVGIKVLRGADKGIDAVRALDKGTDALVAADKGVDALKAADKGVDALVAADKGADAVKAADKVEDLAQTGNKAADAAKKGAGHNKVHGPPKRKVRQNRQGTKSTELTYPDGSVKDISPSRVKEFVPNTHPKAPPGKTNPVKFDNPLPGTKGKKRMPTPEELDELKNLITP